MRFNTQKYRQLELFIKTEPGKTGRLHMISGSARKMFRIDQYRKWMRIAVNQGTTYEVTPEDCEISYAYLSGCENIMERGICLIQDGRFYGKSQWAGWYDTPVRNQFHLSPLKGWMNDPNGLCWYRGYYHMFYQTNPYEQHWSNMYWGHAVSKDLVHWTHLPIVLAPQPEALKQADHIKSGAFSGSAVAMEDQVFFYLTRHYGPLEDGPDTIEEQWMTSSCDMLHFEPEQRIISEKPEGANFDFRDPKVLKIGKICYLVLGTNFNGKAAILLYRSLDGTKWSYVHPLFIEQTEGIRCFECPDFFELDGKYAAIGAWMSHYDELGRYQMSRYYIGSWKDEKLEVEQSGWFDFGSNCS